MLNSATPDFDLPSTSLVGLLPEEPACYGVIMGMSTVLLEGAGAQWDIHSLSMPQWDVQDDARPSQDRLSSVIHPSGNRKEETHSRDVFPHFPRASERASEHAMRWRRRGARASTGESESPLRHKRERGEG